MSVHRIITLTPEDRRGLAWLQGRSTAWLFGFKRHRKYGASARSTFSESEIEVLKAITGIQDNVAKLLDDGGEE